MTAPNVTIVVVPRERFSFAADSLESIYAQTNSSFSLIYVDGGSPAYVKRHLEKEAERKGFQLIRTDHYLTPNQARNLGLRHVKSEYVVFIDNDVLVAPGWLEALKLCAEETGAWICGPLCLMGNYGSRIIHMAGGKARFINKQGKRLLFEEHRFEGSDTRDLPFPFQREPIELIEFHCMLARAEVFDKLGSLDEDLLSLHEHIDLCFAVREAGGSVYFEPQSEVTYVPPPPIAWSDIRYYMLRWSERWNMASLRHFQRKWNLDEEDPMISDQLEYGRYRRRHIIPNKLMDTYRRVLGTDSSRIKGTLNYQ